MLSVNKNAKAEKKKASPIQKLDNSAGDLLRNELQKRGLSQRTAAVYAKIPQGHLSDMVRGERKIGLTAALRIEKAFDIDAEKIFLLRAKQDFFNARNDYRIQKSLTNVVKYKKRKLKSD
jgi:plasmid maintenance system antidote protein VapI